MSQLIRCEAEVEVEVEVKDKVKGEVGSGVGAGDKEGIFGEIGGDLGDGADCGGDDKEQGKIGEGDTVGSGWFKGGEQVAVRFDKLGVETEDGRLARAGLGFGVGGGEGAERESEPDHADGADEDVDGSGNKGREGLLKDRELGEGNEYLDKGKGEKEEFGGQRGCAQVVARLSEQGGFSDCAGVEMEGQEGVNGGYEQAPGGWRFWPVLEVQDAAAEANGEGGEGWVTSESNGTNGGDKGGTGRSGSTAESGVGPGGKQTKGSELGDGADRGGKAGDCGQKLGRVLAGVVGAADNTLDGLSGTGRPGETGMERQAAHVGDGEGFGPRVSATLLSKGSVLV
ncbi:hypothetical protein PTTG_09050, partial [Puccinia triticina 1-1 BBBD Race 1]